MSSKYDEGQYKMSSFNTSNATSQNQSVTTSFVTTETPEPPQDNLLYFVFFVVTPILFFTITIIGVIGNSLVIYVMISNKKMRTVINLLLLNLAIADLTFVILVPPSTAYYLAATEWALGLTVCKLINYSVYVSAFVTVYTLVLISLIRFLTVDQIINITSRTTKTAVSVSVGVIWTLILLINLPIYFGCSVFLAKGSWVCGLEDINFQKKAIIVFFCLAYLLPLACIGLLSLGILRHIEKNRPTMLDKQTRSRSEIKKRQTSRLLILVVVFFTVSWLPTHLDLLITSLYQVPDNNYYHLMSVLFRTLSYSNSCVNPIIYNHTSKDFRDAFKHAIKRCCCCFSGIANNNRLEEATLMTARLDVKNNGVKLNEDECKMVVNPNQNNLPSGMDNAG